jgi:type IV pilus assembly protein PilW
MKKIMRQESGMTLVELLVSLVISSFIIAGVYGVYTIQKKSYTVQEQVAEMQQRLRSTMDLLRRDIMIAGSNPADEAACGKKKKILKAQPQEMIFNACNFEDKESPYGEVDNTNYQITISFDKDSQELGLKRDKDMDDPSDSPTAIDNGVDWFEMLYIKGYDDTGNPEPADVDTEDGRDKIRAVQISLLIRSTYPDMKYTDTNTYEMASGATWSVSTSPSYENKEHYHRRLLVTTIQLRNMLQ